MQLNSLRVSLIHLAGFVQGTPLQLDATSDTSSLFSNVLCRWTLDSKFEDLDFHLADLQLSSHLW